MSVPETRNGARESEPLTNADDRFGQLTVADLQLIAHARGTTVAANASLDEMVDLLGGDDARARTAARAEHSTQNAPERKGWWASLSVGQLHDIARQHGINVPPGTRRRAVVDLLIEHHIPGPAHPAFRTTLRPSS